jgi:hypothetical protein
MKTRVMFLLPHLSLAPITTHARVQ